VIGRKENTMRVEQARAKMGAEDFLSGALMSLLLAAGVLLSFGAPAKHATSSIEVGRPEAAKFASTTPDVILPGEEIADRDTLDLQLD
jgi:hypothetical protein